MLNSSFLFLLSFFSPDIKQNQTPCPKGINTSSPHPLSPFSQFFPDLLLLSKSTSLEKMIQEELDGFCHLPFYPPLYPARQFVLPKYSPCVAYCQLMRAVIVEKMGPPLPATNLPIAFQQRMKLNALLLSPHWHSVWLWIA